MKRMLLFALLAGALFACDKNNPEPEALIPIGIKTVIGDAPFVLGQDYPNLQGRLFRFDFLQLYVSDIKLVKTDGSEVALYSADQDEPVWLFDFTKGKVIGTNGSKAADGTLRTEAFAAPAGEYEGLKFTLGVPAQFNGQDPVTYPTSHPLSEFNGAHWTWNSGYIFLKIDGQFDDSPTADGTALNGSLTYHTGLDALRREVAFTGAQYRFSLTADDKVAAPLDMTFDVEKLFYSDADTIDMVEKHLTHTTNDYDLAEKLMNNLASHAISLP